MAASKRRASSPTKGSPKRPAPSAAPSAKGMIPFGERARGFWAFIAIFFFSGLCGLVYEVVWSRLLTLVFGNTTYAISTVVGVFMFGLALGSYLCGKILPRIKNLLQGYAFLEIAIGVYAALFLPLLAVVQSIHSYFFPSIYDHPLLLNLTRILLSFGLLLGPTVMMGATLPLLGQALVRSPRFIGRDTGALYALNTLGAALGCFASAFLFIPALGIQMTIWTAAGANGIIGLIARHLSRTVPLPAKEGEKRPNLPPHAADEPMNGQPRITKQQYLAVLLAFMVSGLLALVYEVAWTRALILVFGTSVYAFATILTTYLLGLVFGSLILGGFMDRLKQPISCFFFIQAAIGLFVFLTTPVIGLLPDYFLAFFSGSDLSWQAIALKEFLICFLIIMAPTFASGASFPLVARIFTQYQGFKVGRTLAMAYTVNTIGGLLGSMATGFLLIPALGVEKTLLLGGGGNLLVAAFLSLFALDLKKPARFISASGPVLAAIAGFVLLPSWNPKVINSGVYIYAKTMAQNLAAADVRSAMANYQLLFYREGSSANVAVFQRDHTRFLRVNGKTDGGNSSDNYTQIFLGLLPVMYSPHHENALVIGLGTGITLGSVLDYPGKKVDCVELSPEVVEASNFFNEDNGLALQNPRVRLHVLDGRTWLMAMPERYDLITSEPSHPWQTGNANLFTVEFFEMTLKRLKKEGVFCQWLPIYHMDTEDFRLLVSSFKRVFPHVHVWMATTDALLIGSASPLAIDHTALQKLMALPKIKARLARVQVNTLEDLLSFFYLDDQAVDRFAKGVTRVNSDDDPVLEFSAPKYLLGRVSADTFFAFLNLSHESKLPLVNAPDPAGVQQKRIQSRAAFFRQWRIPEEIIRQMLSNG